MKKIFLLLALSISAAGIFFSCKKETSCEGCIGNKPPIALAGPDQVITLPTDSISLDGSASNDPDGTISEWLWKKIAGPDSFNIVNSTTTKTIVRNLDTGIYKFELKVTDDKNLSAIDTVQIIVNDRSQPNRPPVADAGTDQTIALPNNSINLDGSASTDPDNNIISYLWSKISGPGSFSINNANASQTQITNLNEGIYKFELKVTDALGLFDKDTVTATVQVTVCPQASNPPPCVTNCGKIVFVSNRDGNDEIYTCNADGSNVSRLTNDPAWDQQPVWSPDGTRIAFVRNIDSNHKGDLYIMNADGSNIVQKTFTKNIKNPAWSPDGMRIAFNRVDFNNGQIIVMELSTGSVSILPNTMGASVEPSPAWSPDGTKIAFDQDWNAWDIVSDIFTICPNGSNRNLLTPQFVNDYDYWKPAWSPNGSKLSVSIYPMVSQVGNNIQGRIGVMNQDGSALTIIIVDNMGEYTTLTKTSWSPAGQSIAYTSWGTNNTKTIKWIAANGSGASGTLITNGWDADWKH